MSWILQSIIYIIQSIHNKYTFLLIQKIHLLSNLKNNQKMISMMKSIMTDIIKIIIKMIIETIMDIMMTYIEVIDPEVLK